MIDSIIIIAFLFILWFISFIKYQDKNRKDTLEYLAKISEMRLRVEMEAGCLFVHSMEEVKRD